MNSIGIEYDRVPPQDNDAERCALASLMLANSIEEFEMIRRHLRGDDFYQADHQIIFDVLAEMRKSGVAIDAITARNALEKKGLLEEIGGSAYIAEVLLSVPSAAHGEHYAKIVREKADLRRCIETSNDLIKAAYSPFDGDVAKLTQSAILRLNDIASNGKVAHAKSIGEIAIEVIESLDRRDLKRMPTHLKSLDMQIGGLPIGGFSMIAARPGMGKSLVLKNMLLTSAMAGVRTGLVSIEENNNKVGENILSYLSGVNNKRLACGEISTEEWGLLADAAGRASPLPMFVDETPVSIEHVEAAITSLVIRHKCQMIAVDYLQLIDGNEENENREITLVSRRLKACFKRLNVAGLAAVQLNRLSEKSDTKRPSLQCLRGSGSLEQDGDLIILLHSEDYYRRQRGDDFRDNRLLLCIAKNKSGPLADVPMRVHLQTQSLHEIDPGEDAPVIPDTY
jgi:replicative DNA helicase